MGYMVLIWVLNTLGLLDSLCLSPIQNKSRPTEKVGFLFFNDFLQRVIKTILHKNLSFYPFIIWKVLYSRDIIHSLSVQEV